MEIEYTFFTFIILQILYLLIFESKIDFVIDSTILLYIYKIYLLENSSTYCLSYTNIYTKKI